jgi:cytochrome d ubiquinol oxidase subunit II
MYVVMDGFDLGIGILFPVFGVGRERDTAMNSIAPVWDGNETWLVLGGGGLLAAFPLAYGIIMTALYPPLIAMLLALVFRGVAFEFRWRDPGTAVSGISPSRAARLSPRSCKASCWARCCRAYRLKAGHTGAAGGTGSRRSLCGLARAWSRAIPC